jgi:hypothetical protein
MLTRESDGFWLDDGRRMTERAVCDAMEDDDQEELPLAWVSEAELARLARRSDRPPPRNPRRSECTT